MCFIDDLPADATEHAVPGLQDATEGAAVPLRNAVPPVVSRRALLRAGAAGIVLAASPALAACRVDSSRPPFLDLSDDQLRHAGGIVRLKFGTAGAWGLLALGTSRQPAGSGPAAVVVTSVNRRVLIGQRPNDPHASTVYRGTVTVGSPLVVWAQPTGIGNPGERADYLSVVSTFGELQLDVWVEATQGVWSPEPATSIDLGIVPVHAALMRVSSSAELIAVSPPRARDASGALVIDSHGHEQWELGALNAVESRKIDAFAPYLTADRPENLDPVINLFCMGQAHLADGRMMTAGGHIAQGSITNPVANRIHIYDANATAGRWWLRSAAKLRKDRWYPTVTTLPDGRMLITSGSSQAFTGQFWDDIWLTGYYSHLENNYEIFDPAAGAMVDLGDPPQLVDLSGEPMQRPLATYPAVFVLPGGTARPHGVLLLQEANRGWLYAYQPSLRETHDAPPLVRAARTYRMPDTGSRSYPHYGSAVLLPFRDGDTRLRILVVGGQAETEDDHKHLIDNEVATRTAVLFDYDSSRSLTGQSGWRRTASMANRRELCDATILADGKVLVTGGVSAGWTNHNRAADAVYQAEMYDPATEEFTTMAEASLDRRYHSTALLMPDGTLAKMGSTGGFDNGNDPQGKPWISAHTHLELFHPPYQFRSPAPLLELPAEVTAGAVRYGSQVRSTVSGFDLTTVTIAMIKTGVVTHGFNTGQRHITLEVLFTSLPSGYGLRSVTVDFKLPTDPTVAPPGDYLVVAIDNFGVPSRGLFVRLG